jgi:hypothetical protein
LNRWQQTNHQTTTKLDPTGDNDLFIGKPSVAFKYVKYSMQIAIIGSDISDLLDANDIEYLRHFDPTSKFRPHPCRHGDLFDAKLSNPFNISDTLSETVTCLSPVSERILMTLIHFTSANVRDSRQLNPNRNSWLGRQVKIEVYTTRGCSSS